MAEVSWETPGEGELHVSIEGLGFSKVFFKGESLMLYFGEAYFKKTRKKTVSTYHWRIKHFSPEKKVLIIKKRA